VYIFCIAVGHSRPGEAEDKGVKNEGKCIKETYTL